MANQVERSRDGTILHLILARPDKINAMNAEMMMELATAIMECAAAGTQLLVISGAGERGFCAGADIKEFLQGPSALEAQERGLRAVISALSQSPVPVLSLLHGRTMGAGVMIAALSDLVIAADNLMLGFPEIQFGMYPAMMHAVLLERVPAAIAWQLCATGRILTGDQARNLGLVSEVVAASQFATTSVERAAFYAARSAGLLVGRRALRTCHGRTLAQRVDAAALLMHENFALPDIAAGITGYLRNLGVSRRTGDPSVGQ